MLANISRCAERSRHLHILNNGALSSMAHFSSASAAMSHTFTSVTNNTDTAPTSLYPVNSSLLKRSQPVIQLAASITSRPASISSARRQTAYQRFSTSTDSDGNNTNEKATPIEQTKSFLLSIGYSDAVSDGIVNAILQNGIPPTSLFSMIKGLAGRYEVGEDGGLEVLAASVKTEIEKLDGKSKVKVRCLPSTGWSPAPDSADDNDDQQLPIIQSVDRAFEVEAIEGTTLTDVAKFGTSDNCDVLGEYLECACSGIMACSTCHVVIHPDWYDATIPADGPSDSNKIGPPSEAEQDMIDLAYEPQVTSRLGCKIKLTKELDGLVVLLPRGSNNLMDFTPFE